MGWTVQPTPSDAHAATLFTRVCQDHAVPATGLVLHADTGGPMKGATMRATGSRPA
jgi:putative transposase